MDAMVRGSVVSITGNCTGTGVYCVGPLPVVCVDGYDEVIQALSRSTITKTTGITTFQQYGKRVIGDITGFTTFIDGTCRQVDTFQLCKGYGDYFAIQYRKPGLLFQTIDIC